MNKNIIRGLVFLVFMGIAVAGLSLYGVFQVAPSKAKLDVLSRAPHVTHEQMVSYYQNPEHSKQLKKLIASQEVLTDNVIEITRTGFDVFISFSILGVFTAIISLWVLRLARKMQNS